MFIRFGEYSDLVYIERSRSFVFCCIFLSGDFCLSRDGRRLADTGKWGNETSSGRYT